MARQTDFRLESIQRSIDGLARQIARLDTRRCDSYDCDNYESEDPMRRRILELEREKDQAEMLANNYKQRLEYALHYKNQPKEFRRLVVDLFKAINGYVPGDGDQT